MLVVFGLWLGANAVAAEVAMPSEAEVVAALQKQGDRTPVCVAIGLMPGRENSMTIQPSDNYDYWDKRIKALAAAGLATRKEQPAAAVTGLKARMDPAPATGLPAVTAEYTQAGHAVFDANGAACLGVRKLTSVFAFTPPAAHEEYTVVHVAYWWVPSQSPAWATTMLKTGGVDELNALLGKPQWANDVLIYTSQGWTVQSDFGNPIQSRSAVQ